MHKRTIILLVVLGLVSLGLMASAMFFKKTDKNIQQNTQVINSIAKTAVIKFTPESLTISRFASASSNTVLIMADAKDNSVSGVQLELVFDPKAFLSFEIIPAFDSIMGKLDRDYSVIINNTNFNNGNASFQAGIIPANITPRTGVGAIAAVKFQINPSFANPSTPISFIKQKTLVTQKNVKESVLSEIKPLIINIK